MKPESRRCRVCRGYYKALHKSVVEHAGFCSSYCAGRGREMFREYVAMAAIRNDKDVLVICDCRHALKVPAAKKGKRVPCDECGIDIWIPLEAFWKKAPRSCPRCGRTVGSGGNCIYCGTQPFHPI